MGDSRNYNENATCILFRIDYNSNVSDDADNHPPPKYMTNSSSSSNRAIWADRLDIANKVGSFVDQNGHAFTADELRGIVAEFDQLALELES